MGSPFFANASGAWAAPAAAAASYKTNVLSLSPVAYWPMDEASGNLVDASGNGWTGTVTGSPTYEAAGPTINGAAQSAVTWSGSGQYAHVSSSLTSPASDGLTIAAWVKTSSATVQSVFARSVTADHGYYMYVHSSGVLQCRLRQAGGTTFAGELNIAGAASGSWVFVAMRFDGTTLRGWVDSSTADDSTLDGTWNYGTSAVPGIADTGYGGNLFNGSMCHLAVWSSDLSDAQMTSLRTGVF